MNVSRVLYFFLMVSLVVALTGCQPSAPGSSPENTSSTSTSTGTSVSTAPGGTTSDQTDLDGNPVTGTNTNTGTNSGTPSGVSGVAAKVAQIAATFPGRYNGYQKFPYDRLTQGGNLGCAQVVSHVLREAGVNAYSLGCYDLRTKLLGQGWKRVSPPPYKPGDVVIWSPPAGGRHPHIGVVVQNGNSMKAMNNSSGSRKPILSDIEYRRVETVLRAA
jgi:cell wall-associated NlpC family hydrolase